MAVPTLVDKYLNDANISYEVVSSDSHESVLSAAKDSGIPMHQLARTVVIRSQEVQRLIVVRACDLLDFSLLSDAYGSQISIVDNFKHGIAGCDPDSRVPLASLLKMDVVIDSAVKDLDVIYIDSGRKYDFIRLNIADFTTINQAAIYSNISCPPERLYNIDHQEDGEENKLFTFTPKRIHQRVEETMDLPAMPSIAQEVMRLRVDPNAGAMELAQVVEQDPSLAAQVISWASSPYYGYQGSFDLVLNLALGISVGKSLNVTNDGPLGLKAYWKQSVYNATLSEKLTGFIQGRVRPQRGLVYLSGLLHNFGQLLLGHLFPPQFYLINHYVAMNPHIPLADIENYLLSTNHLQIGSWLMTNWNMPEELITAVRHHHSEDIYHDHATYANLVLISNRLLKRIGVGDASQTLLPEAILDSLGIQEEDAFKALDLIVSDERELDSIATQLVA